MVNKTAHVLDLSWKTVGRVFSRFYFIVWQNLDTLAFWHRKGQVTGIIWNRPVHEGDLGMEIMK